MKRVISCWLFIFCLWFVSPTEAQVKTTQNNGEVAAQFSAEPTMITVGDSVVLTLIVSHPAGWRVIPSDLPTTWGELELMAHDSVFMQPTNNGLETTYQIFDVTAWRTGDVATPMLAIQISDEQGVLQDIQVQPITLTVRSVLSTNDVNLRDIKPQAGMTPPSFTMQYLLFILLILLFAVAIGLMIWHFYWRKKTTTIAHDHRSPLQIALDNLDHIEQASLPSQHLFKQHYSRVADTLRIYLAQQYHITSMERTSFEIDDDLAEIDVLSIDDRRSLMRLLNNADLVKFAKMIPNAAESRHFINETRHFIKMTQQDTADEPTLDEIDDQQQEAEGEA